jgi:hypothetical protein
VAKVPVMSPDLDSSAVFGPRPAAGRALAGNLLIPPNPEAAIGQLEHIIDANRGLVFPPGRPARGAVHGKPVTPLRAVYLRKRRLSRVVTLHVTLDAPAEACPVSLGAGLTTVDDSDVKV